MEISPHFCSVLGGGDYYSLQKKTHKKRETKKAHTHKKKEKKNLFCDLKNDPFFVCMDP